MTQEGRMTESQHGLIIYLYCTGCVCTNGDQRNGHQDLSLRRHQNTCWLLQCVVPEDHPCQTFVNHNSIAVFSTRPEATWPVHLSSGLLFFFTGGDLAGKHGVLSEVILGGVCHLDSCLFIMLDLKNATYFRPFPWCHIPFWAESTPQAPHRSFSGLLI